MARAVRELWSAQEVRRLKGMVEARMSLAAMVDALERVPDEIRKNGQGTGALMRFVDPIV